MTEEEFAMDIKRLLKTHFTLMTQAKEAGYITGEERAMLCELARRGGEWRFDAKTPAEFGWLIETGDHKYWNGKRADSDGFTHDPNEAVRFARFGDSERIIHWLMQSYSVFLVSRQHSWMNGDAQRKASEPTPNPPIDGKIARAMDDFSRKIREADSQPGGCLHCGHRHPPDGMCV